MPKLAIVTGGASGLGRAICLALAREPGWHVVVADVDAVGAAQTLAEIELLRAAGGKSSAEVALLDVTRREDWLELRRRLRTRFETLDLLVNNAGLCASGEVGPDASGSWERLLEVNFFGSLRGCQAMVEWLKESRDVRPRIINVASIAGLLSAPAMGAYNASKAAVISLSETLFAELEPLGVQVSLVAPGFFASQLLDRGDFTDRRHLARARRFVRNATFTAADVARIALKRNAGLYVVVGRRARWLALAKRAAPTTLLRKMGRSYRAMMGDMAPPR
ncbi:MAG: SDR family NAD(P)-dependent oxidoreductase [Planctomycetales bacterium]|nr:SDR family NAD(P)-dependent oxidoreductase [Planctomycetales bacterium]